MSEGPKPCGCTDLVLQLVDQLPDALGWPYAMKI